MYLYFKDLALMLLLDFYCNWLEQLDGLALVPQLESDKPILVGNSVPQSTHKCQHWWIQECEVWNSQEPQVSGHSLVLASSTCITEQFSWNKFWVPLWLPAHLLLISLLLVFKLWAFLKIKLYLIYFQSSLIYFANFKILEEIRNETSFPNCN